MRQGSTLAARRAGRYDASTPTASTPVAVKTSVLASVAETPNKRLESRRDTSSVWVTARAVRSDHPEVCSIEQRLKMELVL